MKLAFLLPEPEVGGTFEWIMGASLMVCKDSVYMENLESDMLPAAAVQDNSASRTSTTSVEKGSRAVRKQQSFLEVLWNMATGEACVHHCQEF